MSNLKLGINEIDNNGYHSDTTYLSSSDLKLLLTDIQAFHKKKILGEREEQVEKPAFSEGSYVHALILEPEVIPDEFAFYPGWRKQGKEWESFRDDKANAGKIILSKPQKVRCEQYFEAYKDHPVAHKFVQGGFPEHTICVNLHGVPLKIRTDYINAEDGYIADVKTSGYSVEQDMFKETIKKFSYDLSAALYCEVAKEFYKKNFDFNFIAISKSDKTCEVFKASEETMEKGRVLMMRALRIYKNCMKTGDWSSNVIEKPSYDADSEYEILEV